MRIVQLRDRRSGFLVPCFRGGVGEGPAQETADDQEQAEAEHAAGHREIYTAANEKHRHDKLEKSVAAPVQPVEQNLCVSIYTGLKFEINV